MIYSRKTFGKLIITQLPSGCSLYEYGKVKFSLIVEFQR